MKWLPFAILVIGLLVLLASGDQGSIGGIEGSTLGLLVMSVALLVFLLGNSELRQYAGRMGDAARDIAIWLGIVVVLVAAYSYRQQFADFAARLTGEFTPPGDAVTIEGRQPGERAIRIRRRGDGHFIANTMVDGVRVPMIVDTGASTVVLRSTDAQALGINTAGLSFSIPVNTANGTSYTAAVRLRSIGIGPIELQGLDALVAAPGSLKESLLGLNFLRRLRSYEFSGDFLTLRG